MYQEEHRDRSGPHKRRYENTVDIRKMFGFFEPPLLSAFGTDLYYNIHATSLTTSAFPNFYAPLPYLR